MKRRRGGEAFCVCVLRDAFDEVCAVMADGPGHGCVVVGPYTICVL